MLHAPTGRVSFDEAQLVENVMAVVDAINRAKPSASKGQYVKAVYLSSTMGPSFRIDRAETRSTAA